MPIRDDRGDVDREILDIIPERFDADSDSRGARKSAHTRLALTLALALLALAALGVAARHILLGEPVRQDTAGTPVVHADERPIKTRPQDRGGMEVPNQDKLVYERMSSNAEGEPQPERLLPPPEQPQMPQALHKPTLKSAFTAPPGRETVTPVKPAEPAETPPVAAPSMAAPAASQPPVAPPAPAGLPKGTAPLTTPAATAAAKPALPAGAPVVSAPAVAPAVTAQPSAPSSGSGGWLVQLAALGNEADAKSEWVRLKAANKDLLGALNSDIVRVDLGAKGIFWRLRAGPLGEADARTLCSALIKHSQGCIVARK
ncbi:MAG TPA: SPOR domain-containing protein [Rhodospirillaceae bacterium]|nr:SPOR domain-containing protein [Rhodospirillaceae bacterium]